MIPQIISRLKKDSAIAAVVSKRIFPVHVDQDQELPAIMVNITDLTTNPTKNASSKDDVLDVDVTVYSKRAKEAWDVAELVRNSLDSFSGTMGTIRVQSISMDSMNLNHFAGDDVYICGSEYTAHIKR